MPTMRVRNTRAAAAIITAITVVALLSGCDIVSSIKNDGVSNPITPAQSKTQVVDAAKDIVGILNLQVQQPAFWHASCNDQDEAPFRGQMTIGYPLPSNAEAADAEVAQMIKTLQTKGWTIDSEAHGHGVTLTKNGVMASLSARPANSEGILELLGECRDTTTTKDTKGRVEDVNLSTP
jgi:hypothetical protein